MKKKPLLFALLGISSVVSLSLNVATFAKYALMDQVTQQIGYQGKTKKTIYINPNIWEKDQAEFFIYCYNTSTSANKWITSSKYITPEINDITFSMYVFQFDDVNYDGFNIVRLKPSTAEGYDSGNDGMNWNNKWNQTDDISLNANINYYCINGWGTTYSTYETNHLSVVNNQLVFD